MCSWVLEKGVCLSEGGEGPGPGTQALQVIWLQEKQGFISPDLIALMLSNMRGPRPSPSPSSSPVLSLLCFPACSSRLEYFSSFQCPGLWEVHAPCPPTALPLPLSSLPPLLIPLSLLLGVSGWGRQPGAWYPRKLLPGCRASEAPA